MTFFTAVLFNGCTNAKRDQGNIILLITGSLKAIQEQPYDKTKRRKEKYKKKCEVRTYETMEKNSEGSKWSA